MSEENKTQYREKIDEICTRKKIIKKVTNSSLCKKCPYCSFIEKLKEELNKMGFLLYNKDIELWKIKYYENTGVKLSPCYSF